MDNLDRQVLEQARDWLSAGRKVWVVTVIETWGSAPRPPGALLAMRDDGLVVGSVSGGCVEDDLIERVRGGERVDRAAHPREIADMMAFLASDRSAYTTGVVVTIDGGLSASPG